MIFNVLESESWNVNPSETQNSHSEIPDSVFRKRD